MGVEEANTQGITSTSVKIIVIDVRGGWWSKELELTMLVQHSTYSTFKAIVV